MSGPLTLVTGATGRTGSLVAQELLERGSRVRAVAHRVDARSERLRAMGAEIVTPDLFDPDQVAAAMKGVQRLYYLPPWHPHMLHSATVFASAARAQELDAVVHLSQWLASPAHPSLATRQNWLVERLFADLVPTAAHVTLNPGFFAENYLGNGLTALAANLGVYPLPIREGRNAPPSNEDIARVAVAVLLDPAPHAGRRYRPTGPQMLSIEEITGALGDAVGRRVRHLPIPMFMFLRALRVMGPRYGIGPYQMSTVRWYYPEHALGSWEVGGLTNDVLDVTGAEPESFATVAGRYARHPANARTAKHTAAALWDMTRIGVTPTPRLDRLVRRQQQPVPQEPLYAAHSPSWPRSRTSNGPSEPSGRRDYASYPSTAGRTIAKTVESP